MQTFSANDAKQNFGEVLDAALRGPVSITKHGRPSVVITSEQDYRELQQLVHDYLKTEVKKGLDDIDAGRVRTFETEKDLQRFGEQIKKRTRARQQKMTK